MNRHFAIAAVLCTATLSDASPGVASEPRAIVELFTSQGCSSCPAADKVLGELGQDPTLITLSLPIDYWDYLGWKDTLALKGHAIRQRAYAEERGYRVVYTPQVVIDGVAQVLGSDKAAIEKVAAQISGNGPVLSVPVKLTIANGQLNVSLPAGPSGQPAAEIWLCPIESKVTVDVGRGENQGHALTYYNVVRGWVKIGTWNGTANSFNVPLASLSGAHVESENIDRLAVIVQTGAAANPGPILGAAITNFH